LERDSAALYSAASRKFGCPRRCIHLPRSSHQDRLEQHGGSHRYACAARL